MKITKSPTEALKIIDKLVAEGTLILHQYRIDVAKRKDKIEKDVDDYNNEKTDKLPDYKVLDGFYKKYLDDHKNWWMKVANELNDLMVDTTPKTKFVNANKLLDTKFKEKDKDLVFYNIECQIEKDIEVLVGFYDEISAMLKSPLFYIPNRATIYFYGIACELTRDSMQADLCEYMFDNFSIGEWVEYETIYEFLGERKECRRKWKGNWHDTIYRVADEVNKKTRKDYKFPIFKSQKKLHIALTLPNRIVSELK
jgi:hypothetical protein